MLMGEYEFNSNFLIADCSEHTSYKERGGVDMVQEMRRYSHNTHTCVHTHAHTHTQTLL